MSDPTPPTRRRAYCVLGAGSLPYARLAIASLLARCEDALDLHLITDAEADRAAIAAAVAEIDVPARHQVSVHAQAELDAIAETAWADWPHLRAFRFGHPCWRKLTDPLLLAAPGEEMLILDPDLYFPNAFTFDPTPARGVLLMWQPPSCLLPPEVVRRAYDQGVALAHHVDIGVAQARHNWDLAWLDDLIARLGGTALPRAMHIEAIIWAALAQREGGGYLPPEHWHCWRNTHGGRLARKLGASGERQLHRERWAQIKCFHGGGAAKWWVPGLVASGALPAPTRIATHLPPQPFEPLTRAEYEAGQRWKDWARRLGYYRVVGG
ncbi:MAG: hypothetical protein LCH73_10110 [Proteobacteria bacterium]|nr:hypothetical protein [Pseudomonadota bacterium]